MILVIAAMAAISGAVALSSTEASAPLGRSRLGRWPRRFRQVSAASVDGDGAAVQDGAVQDGAVQGGDGVALV